MQMETVQPRQPSVGFSCAGCRATFEDAEGRKDHYATEWHRHNLKRKVANLPPVDRATFESRLAVLQETRPGGGAGVSQTECTLCGKKFANEKARQHHLRSKMHTDKEKAALSRSESQSSQQEGQSTETVGMKTNERHAAVRAAEMTQEEFMEWKIKTATKLELTDCLFCRHHSADLDKNMKHMYSEHGFFVPYIENVVDLEGLITYLGEKVSIGNFCLWCDERGRAFHSLEAVRAHMVEKSHCRVLFEGNEEEFEAFYDYDDPEAGDWEDEGEWEEGAKPAGDEEDGDDGEGDDDFDMEDGEGRGGAANFRKPPIQMPDRAGRDPAEIALTDANGNTKVLGHRSLRRYYKQKPAPIDENENRIRALICDYQGDGVNTRMQVSNWLRKGVTTAAQRNSIRPRDQKKIDRASLKVQTRKNMLFTCYTAMNTMAS